MFKSSYLILLFCCPSLVVLVFIRFLSTSPPLCISELIMGVARKVSHLRYFSIWSSAKKYPENGSVGAASMYKTWYQQQSSLRTGPALAAVSVTAAVSPEGKT